MVIIPSAETGKLEPQKKRRRGGDKEDPIVIVDTPDTIDISSGEEPFTDEQLQSFVIPDDDPEFGLDEDSWNEESVEASDSEEYKDDKAAAADWSFQEQEHEVAEVLQDMNKYE